MDNCEGMRCITVMSRVCVLAWLLSLMVGAVAATVTISCVGDLLLHSPYESHGSQPLSGTAEVLCRDDLTVGNLECAISTRGTPADKQYTFRVAPSYTKRLTTGGIDVVSLANNHTLDYGRVALGDTMDALRRAGVGYAGAGANAADAYAPVLRTLKGQRVAVFAASRVLPAVSWYATASRSGLAAAYDPARLLAAIRRARAENDIVLVYLHWGKERATHPEAYQRTLAHQCIDAGADAVIGAHPHVLQGFEYYRGKLIAYSLGNFVFAFRDTETAILQLEFVDGAFTTARVIPCRVQSRRPSPMTKGSARDAMLRTLQQRSFGVEITSHGNILPRSRQGE